MLFRQIAYNNWHMNKNLYYQDFNLLNKNWYIRKRKKADDLATLNRDQQIEEIINLEAILNLPKRNRTFCQ